MTNEELADAVAKIAELDADYQREVAHLHKTRIKALDGYKFDTSKYINLKPIKPAQQALYAAAPLMAQVIRQLWDEREANRAVMEQARDKLSSRSVDMGDYQDVPLDDYEAALAALDDVLGNKGGK